MNDPEYQRLKETGWRRPLTPAEEETLRKMIAAQPALQSQWDQEAALNRLLVRLPRAQISSNFTARVVQAARQSPVTPSWTERLAPFQWLSRHWMPRVALGFAMLCCGFLTFREYQVMHRAQLARQTAGLKRLAELPPMEWMQNFDTINKLNKVSVADDELLAVLR